MTDNVERTNQNKNDVKLIWTHVYAILFFSYVCLTLLFYLFGYLDAIDQRVKGIDSIYYYIYLPSLFFDGDVNFTNELERIYPPGLENVSEKGLPVNVFSPGPAIFWAPFFLLAHLLTLILQFLGSNLEADGFSSIYQAFIYIANSAYGMVGVFLTALILKLYVKPWPALLALLGVMLATQLTYYFWSITAMSHNTSFAATALFLYLFLSRGVTKWAALSAALMIMARWQNALFLLPVAFVFANRILLSLKSKNDDWKQLVIEHSIFAVVLIVGLMPQFLIWWNIYGHFILVPQGGSFLEFSDLPLFSVLFSFYHGLFSWHPLLLVGLVGLVLLWKEQKVLAISFFCIFILQWIVNASVDDWWASWSFGQRRFINLLPVFALGLALLLSKIQSKDIRTLSIAIVFVFSVWNQLFIFQYYNGLIPRGGEITARQMFTDKFRLVNLSLQKKEILLALSFLNHNKIHEMSLHAKNAYDMGSDRIESIGTYGVACLLLGDVEQGVAVFQQWQMLDSKSILPKLGLAELMLKQGEREKALDLFEDARCSADDVKLCADTKFRILNNEQTIMNDQVWGMYTRFLSKLYHQ